MDIVFRKLEARSFMSAEERSAFEDTFSSTRVVQPGCHFLSEGEISTHVGALLSGHLSRQKTLKNGLRQILALPLAGDTFDINGALLDSVDHDISAVTRCVIAVAPHAAMAQLAADHPRLGALLDRGEAVDGAIAREWLTNIGQRPAANRVAHLLCELFVRSDAVGLANTNSCEMPFRQSLIADAVGISVVHINRTLQQLRADKLILLHNQRLTILDWKGLMRMAEFEPGYLRVAKTRWLEGDPSQPRTN